jgi:transcriptional regulator with XRE-family HTH domain
MPRPVQAVSSELTHKIRKILAVRGLSLGQLSRASRSPASAQHLERIPHNLYSSLRTRQFRPNLYQVFALSVLSGYRFTDWLAAFGFSLDDVARLQVGFPVSRTVELDSSALQPRSLLPWFRENRLPEFSAPLTPLTYWLKLATPAVCEVRTAQDSRHRYIKIGSEDCFAFPELVPGSIVRITVARALPVGKKRSKKLFLVKHEAGLVCAGLCRSTAGKFVLCSRHLPFAPVELEEGREAVLMGTADFEIRPLENFLKPVVSARLGRFWNPRPLSDNSEQPHVGKFIQKARLSAGISFREASKRTRVIARTLGDRRYYCAVASLSDYETRKSPPRHIHKLISICTVYFASVTGFLEAAGIHPDKAGLHPMPPQCRLSSSKDPRKISLPSGFFSELERRIGKLPYFVCGSLGTFFGLRNISVRDVFWAGGISRFSHRFLKGALFLVVDRKRKHPRPALSCPKWAQPIYVVQQRGGGYLCGFCTLENGTLIFRSCSLGKPKLLRFRNRVDAEVVGKVIGVARRLG